MTSQDTNFFFLQNQFADLAKTAIQAERAIAHAPEASFVLARRSLEELVVWLYKNDRRVHPPQQDFQLNAYLKHRDFRNIVEPIIYDKMILIQKVGNAYAHDKSMRKGAIPDITAQQIVEELMYIFAWFELHYGENELDRKTRSFKAERIQNNHFDKQEIEKLKKQAENTQSLSQELITIKQQLEHKDAELLALREQIAQAQAKNAQTIAEHGDPNNYNEAQTRKYLIDIMLQEAGWQFGNNLNKEVKVSDFPSPSGYGLIDYVLTGSDGVPLAIVEAKNTAKSVLAGQQQAKLYADSLQKQYGKRPIIFYSNGYQTYLWDDVHYPPRQVQGFYTQQELNRLTQQRITTNTPTNTQNRLSDIPIDSQIVERHYQVRAVKSLLNAFDDRQRAGLLVMATGTGKTRTAIALVDVLMKANRVQKVLFLADRTALVRQAFNNFKALLPDSACVNLVENREQNGRIYFSTYQTMMGLIDEKNDDGTRKFGIGMFDLVIIDEAHRSVYQKFGEIFNYFDSLLVGLTATPRDEIDKDTYHLFGLAKGMPTDYYSLEEAIKDGYLVPPKAFSVPLKFMQRGIKYDELSDEEKAHWESLDWGDREIPDEVESGEINQILFNTDTIDKMLQHLMENGIKVKGGDVLGKTIIFAANQRHAEFIAERFNHHYPAYQGKFARIITHAVNFSQTLIDDFSKKDLAEPQIAISVDMLDTGIDVPEVVNLVFFKPVRSKVKFMQMIGRGTRLCKDLFAPEHHKTEFVIFDYCQNFEFFNEFPNGIKTTQTEPLSKKLFKARVGVLQYLQLPKYQEHKTNALVTKLKGLLHAHITGMNHDNFIVRPKWQFVEHYQHLHHWDNLDEIKVNEINENLSGLPTNYADDAQNDLDAKLFDLLCYNLQLAILNNHASSITDYQKRITKIANNLLTKPNIPVIAKEFELIENLTKTEFWLTVDVVDIEDIREKLRNLIKLIDKTEIKVVYTVLDDDIGETTPVPMPIDDTGVDTEQYKKRVEQFIKANENHITIARLKRGAPLTPIDLTELENFVFTAQAVESKEEFKEHFGTDVSLPQFIRSLVGLDYQAVKAAFSAYLTNSTYNERQIRFIEMIIEQLTKQGNLEASRLYDAPFNQIHYEGIEGLFNDNDIDKIFDTIEHLNHVQIA